MPLRALLFAGPQRRLAPTSLLIPSTRFLLHHARKALEGSTRPLAGRCHARARAHHVSAGRCGSSALRRMTAGARPRTEQGREWHGKVERGASGERPHVAEPQKGGCPRARARGCHGTDQIIKDAMINPPTRFTSPS